MNIKDCLQDRLASIENNSSTTSVSSIELEQTLDGLITGPEYWRKAKLNRYRKLAREGQLAALKQLSEIARNKDNPANWFAKVCSVKQWERTLTYLSKLQEVAQKAVEVAKRVAAAPSQMKTVFKACWRSQDVLRHAITAEETGRDRFKYFCWLVWQGEQKIGR